MCNKRMYENGLLANFLIIKKQLSNESKPHLFCVGGSAPVASAVAVVMYSQQQWPVGGLLLGNHVNAGHRPWHRPLEHVLRKKRLQKEYLRKDSSIEKRCNPNILPLATFLVDLSTYQSLIWHVQTHSPCHKGQPCESKREPSWLSW